MSTRGLYGFIINDELKVTYNHCDSYPTGLGEDVKNFIINNDIEKIKEVASKIRLVKSGEVPSADDISKYEKYYNQNVNGGSVEDFYALLRETQGNLQVYIDDENFDIMKDDSKFLENSLFCEWAYFINLDSGKLEIYQGFQKYPPRNNRYSTEKCDNQGYFPCEIIKEISFENIKNFDMKKLEENELN